MAEFIAATNEALGLFKTLRDLLSAVKVQVENYTDNPQQFRMLKIHLSSVEQKMTLCSEMLKSYSDAISIESLRFQVIDHRVVMNTMQLVVESVDQLDKRLPKRRSFFSAKSINRSITQLEEIVREMNFRLEALNDKLTEIEKVDIDAFVPDFSSIPKVRVPVHLDFSKTETMEGKLKANLLESVERLSGHVQTVNAHVTAVVGVAGMGGVGKTTALIGLAKDADVQEKFSTGGIYFVIVGKDATPEKLVRSLKSIVRKSGGRRRSREIDSTGSLESAVRTTSSWFVGQQALFILDDLWQTSSNEMGYFNELIELLDDSPESHVIISTRSSIIATETSEIIEFKPREIAGSEARKMFLASANLDESLIVERSCEELVDKILGLCGGVPLMLSIAGAQVRRRIRTPIASLRRLLRSLEGSSLLKKQPEHYPFCFNQAVEASFNAIADALVNNEDYKKQWEEYRRSDRAKPVATTADLVIECFQRLCILPRSARVSEDLIFGIWGMYNKKMALLILDYFADFHLLLEFEDAGGNMKYGLHDVLLDYCVQASQLGQDGNYELCHRQFLCYAWKACHGEESSLSNTASVDTQEECIASLDAFWLLGACKRSRSWWKVLSSREELSEVGEYLLQNLFRHLRESRRLAEAVGVLSHMGWTRLRVGHGGIYALNTDFSLVANAVRSHPPNEREQEACDDTLHGIMSIWNMVGKAWPTILKTPENLPTHAYGHLLDDANKLKVVDRYLKSAESIESGPWLKPTRAFWSMLDASGHQRVFRTAEKVVGIAMGSKNVIAATMKMLFWIDRQTMTATREMMIRNENENDSDISAISLCESQDVLILGFSTGKLELRTLEKGNILRKLHGNHEIHVTSVALGTDGRTVVSGSRDKTVRLWDVGSGSQIGQPLRGHNSWVVSVGISGDGRTVVSGSRDNTVRLWDVKSRSQIGQPLRGHDRRVESVGISGNGRTVVSGSWDGTVRLWDVGSGSQIGQTSSRTC